MRRGRPDLAPGLRRLGKMSLLNVTAKPLDLPVAATREPIDAESRAREDKAEIEGDAKAAGIPIPDSGSSSGDPSSAAGGTSTSSDAGDAKAAAEEDEPEDKSLHHLVHKTVKALFPQERAGEDYAIPAWKIQQALSALAIGDGMQIPGSNFMRKSCGFGEWSGSWLPHPVAITIETLAISIADAFYNVILFYIETLSLTFDLTLVMTSIKYLGAVFGTFAGTRRVPTNRVLLRAHHI